MSTIEIYTDGAAKGNPGPGGFGVVMRSGEHEKEISSGFFYTTNNRMELLAVIVALESLKRKRSQVLVYSDSKYVVDAINKKWVDKWKKRSWLRVKNPDLWKRLLKVLNEHDVTFFWIKGHNDHPENERCDQLAVEASSLPNNGGQRVCAEQHIILKRLRRQRFFYHSLTEGPCFARQAFPWDFIYLMKASFLRDRTTHA